MKFVAVASLAFVGAVAAQNSTTAPASGCVLKYNTCRTTRVNGLSANQAQCAADNAQCIGDCYAAYNTCRTARPNGLSANQAQCVSEYATCLGENPVSPTGGLTILPYTATASAYNNSTATAGPVVYTTQVVTAITTVCPAPTAGPYTTKVGPNVYTISQATTITVTNCPCTISMPIAAAPSMPAAAPSMPAAAPSMPAAAGSSKPAAGVSTMAASSAAKNGTASATSTKPAVFTGAAAQVGVAGFGLFGAAAAAMLL